MKFVITMIVLCVSFTAFAEGGKKSKSVGGGTGQEISPNQGSDSCGLGWQVTQEKTMIATTTRGSTNSVIPATFGMTSGTMGCEQHGFAQKEANSAVYAAVNYESLKVEMASGSGEVFTAFATTMGCSNASALSNAVRANYRSLLNSANGHDLYRGVRSVIRANPTLAKTCPNAA